MLLFFIYLFFYSLSLSLSLCPHFNLVVTCMCYERQLVDVCLMFYFLGCSVWVARRPPGYAFIDFDDRRDALDAIRDLDGMLSSTILF